MNYFVLHFVAALSLTLPIYASKKDDQQATRHHRHLSSPEECARTCHLGEKPKTCYYHFTVEYFATLTRACNLCRSTTTTRLIPDCQCITADGYETSGIITANRMYPGPAIMVCLNDYVVIDVDNRIPGNGITIHWHGIYQKGYQYYDGVPFVTQCPIQEGTTFRYQWRAENSGTHFWHSHTGLQKGDGLEGPLIVRQPKHTEPNNELWDRDRKDNVIFINDWFHDSTEDHFPGTVLRRPGQLPDNFLINGLGQWTDPTTGNTTTTPMANITVEAGYRYRFRMINSCSFTCPVELTIEGHKLIIIATDGEPVKPVLVTSITSSSAERYDFILTTDKKPGHYWIQLRGLGNCESSKLQQLAFLSYESAPKFHELAKPSYDVGLDPGIILNPLNVRCDDLTSEKKFVCVSQLESAVHVPNEITKEEPDIRMYVPYGFYTYQLEDIFKPGTYKRFLVAGNQVAATVGNISNVFPPSPYISQRNDIPDDDICWFDNVPSKCDFSRPCACSHVQKIPLASVVEIILVDEAQIPGLSHPFHIHGHGFHVIGEGRGIDHGIRFMNLEKAKDLHKRGMMRRNLYRPPAKDTYAVPNNGYSIIRMLANNPGYWLFHCHFMFHLSVGMSLVLHVGEDADLPPIPEGFPQCGNFAGPINDN